MAIYHAYTQTVADGTATSVVRPSDWNSGHVQGFFLAGNTSNASSVTGTDIYLSGGNGVTLSGSNNSIGISVATGFNVSAGTTSNNITQLVFPNSNGVTWGLSSNSLTANIPMLISAANGTGAPATLSFQDGGGVSWSTNANGIQASVAGGGGSPQSFFEPTMYGTTTTGGVIGNAVVQIQPFYISNPVTMNRINILHYNTTQATTTQSISASVSGGNATSGTGSGGTTYSYWLLSRQSTGTNANSTRLLTFTSGTVTQTHGIYASVSWSTNASSATASFTTSGQFGYVGSIDSTGGVTYATTGSSASSSFSSTSTAANSFSSSFVMTHASQMQSNARPLFYPCATSLSAGEYWIAQAASATTGSTSIPLQNVNSYLKAYLNIQSLTNAGYLGYGFTATSGGSGNRMQGQGQAANSSSFSTTIGISAISGNGSNFYFNLGMFATT